jgi:hypothetical protein
MNETIAEFKNLQRIREEIANLEKALQLSIQRVNEAASEDFANHLNTLRDTVKAAYPKSRLTPTQWGFIVTTPEFKELNGVTDIKKKINSMGIATNFVNVVATEYYADQNIPGPKVVTIKLTKGYIQKINPAYKEILMNIDL